MEQEKKNDKKDDEKDHPDIELDNGGKLTWCELCESYWQCGCE